MKSKKSAYLVLYTNREKFFLNNLSIEKKVWCGNLKELENHAKSINNDERGKYIINAYKVTEAINIFPFNDILIGE